MPIKCQICQQEFPKLIGFKHLKKHDITSAEYKKQYGKESLASPEYRAQRSQQYSGKNNPNYGNRMRQESKDNISKKRKGSTPWNKGKKFDDTVVYKKAAELREQRYKNGELERKTHDYSAETREKISISVKNYAKNNPEEMSRRAKQALETKRQNGYDLAFFKGMKHSPEAKEKIAQASRNANQTKTTKSIEKAQRNAKLAQCTIISMDHTSFQLRCDNCKHEFARTKQYLTATGKFNTELCEICYPRSYQRSQVENDIAEYIQSLGVKTELNARHILSSKKEIDIYVPEKNLAIEVNGVYWHSQIVLEAIGQSKLKDYEKYIEAGSQDLKLITVYDVEWIEKQSIVRSRIAGMLGQNKTIGARQTTVKQLSSKEANEFLRENHLQGSGRSNVRYGLFQYEQLVSVMTFSKENISRKSQEWEINRFCTKQGMTVSGGASKLFKQFLRDYAPQKVISYSDNRWGDGKLYMNLGFQKISTTPPNYWYVKPNDTKLYHRYALRKTKTDKQELTEWQNRQQQGWNRIWDCGSSKWEFENTGD